MTCKELLYNAKNVEHCSISCFRRLYISHLAANLHWKNKYIWNVLWLHLTLDGPYFQLFSVTFLNHQKHVYKHWILTSFIVFQVISPLSACRGNLGLLVVNLSVSLPVRPSVSQTFFTEFSLMSYKIDFKFGIWITLGIIQIKYEFRRAWFTFTRSIAICQNLVFQSFLCRRIRYWLGSLYVNWFRYITDHVWVSSRLTYFYIVMRGTLCLTFTNLNVMTS